MLSSEISSPSSSHLKCDSPGQATGATIWAALPADVCAVALRGRRRSRR
jgi:hypothetical protein